MMLTDTPKTEGRVWLPREQELTVGLSWVLTMGAFRCGWLVVAVAGGVAERWRVPFTSPLCPSHFQSPRIGNHRQLI
jgi:hypothetical protein